MFNKKISAIMQTAFLQSGYEGSFGAVTKCKRPEFGDFSSAGALPAAKKFKKPPRDIASEVVLKLKNRSELKDIRIDGPGYINFRVDKKFIVNSLNEMISSKNYLCSDDVKQDIILDFGGANVAKPLHVGHLRSAIIGECLKRIGRFRGHKVIGDIHLGDWGLQMGMLLHELKLRHPDWPYFNESISENYPESPPVTIDDLEELYPTASQKAKADDTYLNFCRKATTELHQARIGYKTLWRQIVNVSIEDLKKDYHSLNVEFDLWLGESDAHQYLNVLEEKFSADGHLRKSNGALIIDVESADDKHQIPPVIFKKSDGAALYHATDIATIYQRITDHNPSMILYVVDKRQSLHFEQIFRGVRKTGLVNNSLFLKHIPFGTMNGTDGKPFKTRAGGTLKLKDLVSLVTNKALERLIDSGYGKDLSDKSKQYVAQCVGIAALKFGDLSNSCSRDYIFELDQFLEFEGKTGPYLLYSAVKAKSILRKSKLNFDEFALKIPRTDEESKLMLTLLSFPDFCEQAFTRLEPMLICDYAYNIASAFSSFYAKVHILREEDLKRKKSLLALVHSYLQIMETILFLLGINVPDRM